MPHHHPITIVLLALTAAFLVGGNAAVGEQDAPATAEHASSAPEAGSSSGGAAGVLIGRVLFDGDAPPPRQLVVDKDQSHCGPAQRERQDVLVGADNALAGVVVEIGGIKKEGEREWQHPKDGYVIRQKGCAFSPNFLVVPAGADLTVYNNDPVLHNVNAGQWNIAQPGGEDYVSTKKIAYQGRPFVQLKCNVHSWMEANLYVARSPYYAVTGTDGKFKIENIPPGSYKVSARHPKLRAQRFKITIEGGQTVEKEISFRPRSG